MKTTLIFDKEKVYDEQLAPLVKKFYDICFENKMPFFISVTVKASPDAPAEYRRDGFCARTFNKDIEHDQIGSHLAIAAGLGVVCTGEELEIDESYFDEKSNPGAFLGNA